MSFTNSQVGIEDYNETTQLLFPHPPIIEERWAESRTAKAVEISFANSPITVQWASGQSSTLIHLFVRRLTAGQIATLQILRNMTGLMRVKIQADDSQTILCAFGPDDKQAWNSMVAEHPDGSIVPSVFKVYEAHITLIRMEEDGN
jgi:hypothetical protein